MLTLRLRRFLVGVLVSLALGAVAYADDPPPPPPGAPATPEPPTEPKSELEFPNEGLMERADGSVVYFYRTNFVTPADLVKSLELIGLDKLPGLKKAEEGGAFKQFTAQNQLLIAGDPDAVEIALEAVAYFDTPTPQVFIEAKVIEITYDSNFEFGLDFLWDRSETGPPTIFQGASGGLSPPSFIGSTFPGGLPFQGTSLLLGLVGSNASKYGALDLRLQALQENGKAEVLSKPSIIATQGQPAKVTTEERVPVNTLERADNTNEFFKASTYKTGVILEVNPLHIGESYVRLKITPTVNGIAGFATRQGGTLAPIETTRSADTTVTMGDGETLVIGGLYTNRSVKETAKTPLLSEIPLLGCLFTRQHEAKQKTELIFLLTPRIVRKTSELRVIVPPAELERLEGTRAKPEEPCAGGCRPIPYRFPGFSTKDPK